MMGIGPMRRRRAEATAGTTAAALPPIGAVLAVLLSASWFGPAASAADGAAGPQPPCGGRAPEPPYAEVEAQANVRAWSGEELGGDWRPPPCTGWDGAEFQTLVALSARLRHDGGIDGLLERYGAISELTGVRYWSVSDDQWKDLVEEAYAVTGPGEDRQRRADFSAAEMRAADGVYFYQDDAGPAGGAVYRLRVLEAEPGRLVLASENVTEVDVLLLSLFEPGALQSVYFIERLSDGVWGYYSLTRTTPAGTSSLAEGHVKSYINRAAALFRHVAGIPTDRQPPVAP